MKKGKKYYTTGDVSRYCEVDVNTVKSWIKHGSLPAFTTPSGHYRIPRPAFIHFIKTQGFLYDPTFFGEEQPPPDILIIDEDPQQLTKIVKQLRSLYQNLKIETATNSFDGYVKLNQHTPKVVLLDMVFPNNMGIEFLRTIQSNDLVNGLKVLVISDRSNLDWQEKMKNLPVDEWIVKPVDHRQLKEKCDHLFQGVLIP